MGCQLTISTESLQTQLDKLIISLRLTTLMRATDLAHTTWGLFHSEADWQLHNELFIHCTSKTGKRQSFSVKGSTLQQLINYLHRHIQNPAPFLIGHTRNPEHLLGPERIEKRCPHAMQALGIHTDIFKSHSLRGATATHLLRAGVPAHLVQARGHWTNQNTMIEYYGRLHQTQP